MLSFGEPPRTILSANGFNYLLAKPLIQPLIQNMLRLQSCQSNLHVLATSLQPHRVA